MLTNAVAPDRLGGLERYVRELGAALVREGADVTIVARRAQAGADDEEVGGDGVRIVRHPWPPKSSPLFVPRAAIAPFPSIRRELRRRPRAVVHAHYPVPALALALGRRPYLYTFHAPLHREILIERHGTYALPRALQPITVRGTRALERLVVARAARIVVLSEFVARQLRALAPDAAGRTRVLPGGIDEERFSPGEVAPGDHQGPILFCARRLAARMGILELVQGMTGIRREVPGARLVIAGAGPLEGAIRARIASLGLAEAVRLVGRVSDAELVVWYRRADLVVVPSRELEGFGLSTAEALACGTPVVGTPVGATPELLRPLAPDLLAPGTSPTDLAETIVRVLRDAPLRARVASAARARVVPDMGWPTVARAYLEEYRAM